MLFPRMQITNPFCPHVIHLQRQLRFTCTARSSQKRSWMSLQNYSYSFEQYSYSCPGLALLSAEMAHRRLSPKCERSVYRILEMIERTRATIHRIFDGMVFENSKTKKGLSSQSAISGKKKKIRFD